MLGLLCLHGFAELLSSSGFPSIHAQIDVDIGSSSVARGVIGLVLGYVTSLVVDLAILIEVCHSSSLDMVHLISSYRRRSLAR